MWLVSRRSVSDDARHDCYRWRDSDTSQSLASFSAVHLSCSASAHRSSITSKCYQIYIVSDVSFPRNYTPPTQDFRLGGGVN